MATYSAFPSPQDKSEWGIAAPEVMIKSPVIQMPVAPYTLVTTGCAGGGLLCPGGVGLPGPGTDGGCSGTCEGDIAGATATIKHDFPTKADAEYAVKNPDKMNDAWNEATEYAESEAGTNAKKHADQKDRAPQCENSDCDCKAPLADFVKKKDGTKKCGTEIIPGSTEGTYRVQWFCWAQRKGECVGKASQK